MKKALVFGAFGQLGTAMAQCAPPELTVHRKGSAHADFRDHEAITRLLTSCSPDVVVNCAAFTDVDAAEQNRSDATAINATAPFVLARACKQLRSRFVHVSTDFVFDGTATRPYLTNDPVSPINVYGESKAEGERLVQEVAGNSAIVRTSWIHSEASSNFVKTAVRSLSTGKAMRVVDDQYRTPTRAASLAAALWRFALLPELQGIYHFTDDGVASSYELAIAIEEELRRLGALPGENLVQRIRTVDLPTPARRPLYSVLDKEQTWSCIGERAPDWRAGVALTVRGLVGG